MHVCMSYGITESLFLASVRRPSEASSELGLKQKVWVSRKQG